MTVKVKVTDKGLKAYKARAAKLAKPTTLTVGVHGDASGEYGSGASVLDIATWAEFGIGQPQRSFIRAWVEEHKADITAVVTRYGELVVAGKVSAEQAISRMGSLFVASIQARIAGGIQPANAASTVRRKGSSVPLVDSGILKASITFKPEL